MANKSNRGKNIFSCYCALNVVCNKSDILTKITAQISLLLFNGHNLFEVKIMGGCRQVFIFHIDVKGNDNMNKTEIENCHSLQVTEWSHRAKAMKLFYVHKFESVFLHFLP